MPGIKPQFQFNPTYISGVLPIFAKVTFAASGVPTLVTSDYASRGVVSITQNGTGDYSFVLESPALQVLAINPTFASSTGIPAAPVVGIKGSYNTTTKTLNVITSDVETPAATNPGSGETLYLTIWVKATTGA